MYMADSGVVNFTGASTSVRANEFSAPHIGIGTHTTTSNLHLAGDSPEMKIQDVVDQTTETAFKVVVNGGTTHFQTGTTFTDGSDGTLKFQNMGGTNTHVTINSLGDLVAANNVSANTITATIINDAFEQTTAHDREASVLKKYPEVALSSNVQSGYVVSASSDYVDGSQYGSYRLFNETLTDYADAWVAGWSGSSATASFSTSTGAWYQYQSNGAKLSASSGTPDGEWLSIKLPKSIKLDRVDIASRNNSDWELQYLKDFEFWGTTDGTSWSLIKQFSGASATSQATYHSYAINSTTHYNEIAIIITKIQGETSAGSNDGFGHMVIGELKLYGYEEVGTTGDTSLDTTMKSVYNTPDLTSASLYIDGKKSGSTPTDYSGSSITVTNNGSWDSSDNTWVLSGATTSNIVTADLGFEGDQPHSISAWVKADVLNGDGLFHLGTAEGEGDAASRVGFVDDSHISWGGEDHYFSNAEWHNVTYTYNGEGSDKKLYLDGRLVGAAKNKDTFGDYPPFAMTTSSEYGYTVSASSEQSSTRAAWKAFNDVQNTNNATEDNWESGTGYSTTSPYNADGTESVTDTDGNTHYGEWIAIEMPHKLKFEYFNMVAPHSNRKPDSMVILGSNDGGSTFEHMKTISSITYDSNNTTQLLLNALKAFKKLYFITTSVNANNGLVNISHLAIYGHRENDLVRFPDPTNVLKYPHVPMTGPAQRGYVVTNAQATDAGYSIGYNGSYPHSVTNDDIVSHYFGLYDSGTNSPYVTTTGYWDTANYPNLKLSSASGTPAGDWVAIEMPRKLTLGRIELAARNATLSGWFLGESARDFEIWATNDSTNWTRIHQTVDATAPSAINTVRSFDINATTAYKKFALIITRNGSTYSGATGRPVITLGRWHLYGTEPEDVVARIGDGYDGKVRNLRVFSTALSQDRVQEIFDADKDEFALAKSSVSVYRGHLGIGTTEPKAALTVMDEVGELEEFPPRAMTADETYMDGHGVFRASASSDAFAHTGFAIWKAFNKVQGGEGWHSGEGYTYNGSTSPFSYLANADGAVFNVANVNQSIGGIHGQWIKLECPQAIRLGKIVLQARTGLETQAPKDFSVLGSNNNSDWDILQSYVGVTASTSGVQHEVDSNSSYKYFALVTTRTQSTSDVDLVISEIKFFGTREQGASTLHNGELSLTRNLTVPRIGPALDAHTVPDVPQKENLIVEYKTDTNSVTNSTIKDTSPYETDGLLGNQAVYRSYDKSIEMDMSDYIAMRPWDFDAGFVHSFSGWVKWPNEQNWTVLYGVGSAAGTGRTNFTIWFKTNDSYIRTEADGATSFVDHTFEATQYLGNWVHVAVVKSSAAVSSCRIYINGSILPQTNLTGDGNVSIPTNTPQRFYLGNYSPTVTGSASGWYGDISDVKFWKTVLTADEIMELYKRGRNDVNLDYTVTFNKARVGVGLADGEAPERSLDVRDSMKLSTGLHIHQTGTTNWHGSTTGGDSSNQGITFTFRGDKAFDAGGSASYWIMGKQYSGASSFLFSYAGRQSGYLDSSLAAVGLTNFTGQHRTFVREVPFTRAEEMEGMIVSADRSEYVKMSGGIEAGSNAITMNEALPIVSLSNVANDKRCFGVISASEDPETREERSGIFVTPIDKEKGDTRVYINSVGEGAIWVTDVNGPLESGDYITTSNIPGYGMAQSDDLLHNYTVAKITMDCDFNPPTQPIKRIKRSNVVETHYTGLVPVIKSVPHEFVTTVVDADDIWSNVTITPPNVTYAEWSNLEANVQNTYTLEYTFTSNVVYDVKYTLTTTANVSESDAWDNAYIDPPEVTWAEYSNLEANVQNTYTVTFTQTTTDEKTPEEWSALDANAQALWSIQYYDMEEQKVDADYPGAVAHDVVTDRLENDLDEHGQIQWEDTDETEKAYKIRYLDAAGAQTDEANCVHRAAFVGCTYHCG